MNSWLEVMSLNILDSNSEDKTKREGEIRFYCLSPLEDEKKNFLLSLRAIEYQILEISLNTRLIHNSLKPNHLIT